MAGVVSCRGQSQPQGLAWSCTSATAVTREPQLKTAGSGARQEVSSLVLDSSREFRGLARESMGGGEVGSTK